MKIAVVGAGAMGSLIGGMLAGFEQNVTFIDVWEDHVKAINQKGLKIERSSGEKIVHPKAVSTVGGLPKQDLVIIMVKAMFTEDAAKEAAKLCSDHTRVLTLQNGVGNAERIAKFIDLNRIICGTTQNGAMMIGPGHVKQTGQGDTVIGKFGGGVDQFVIDFAQVLNNSGLPAKAVDNVDSIIWSKLMMNASSNALTALLKVSLGDLVVWPETRCLVESCIIEVVNVAKAKGIKLLYEDPIEAALSVMKDLKTHYTTMYQDVIAKRRTEIDVINGAIVEEGRKLNVPTPINEVLTKLVKGLEHTYLS